MTHDIGLQAGERLDDRLTILSPDDGALVIQGGTVLDGLGGRTEDATVFVEAMRVTRLEPGIAEVPEGVTVIDAAGATVMPGLIDLHIHFMGRNEPEPSLDHLRPSHEMKFLRAAFEFSQTLASGVTTVRALGHGPAEHAYALREARRAGLLRGPRMQTSGWALSQTRGHGDVPSLPYAWVEQDRPRSTFCDGALDCRKAVRRNFGEGADVIKVYASNNRTGRPNFTADELEAIVDEAHRRGKRVAAHAKTYEGVRNAVLAGIDTIEHGPDEVHQDLIELMLERGTYLVPTLATVELLAVDGVAWGASPQTIERARREYEGRLTMVAECHRQGVPVGVGSDTGARAGYGRLCARELQLLTHAGMTPADAIRSGTSVSARAMDLDVEIGALTPGRLAELIVVEGDVEHDIALLQDRTNLRAIVQASAQLTN
ncbi:amidohydrolase family protein [Microbacterium sp.]|uniref:metal-dependent hydrolase family protein n=1 Tax=Microbacterium sp. TaxID=51671 RepID=UPI0031FE5BF5|nr:amidohydrolase family protein [Microbacterium sp.]